MYLFFQKEFFFAFIFVVLIFFVKKKISTQNKVKKTITSLRKVSYISVTLFYSFFDFFQFIEKNNQKNGYKKESVT